MVRVPRERPLYPRTKIIRMQVGTLAQLNAHAAACALGGYFRLICRAGSPNLPVQLMDEQGNSYLGIPDFTAGVVKLQTTEAAFGKKKVTMIRLPKELFEHIEF